MFGMFFWPFSHKRRLCFFMTRIRQEKKIKKKKKKLKTYERIFPRARRQRGGH
jgi:hypothetical protein